MRKEWMVAIAVFLTVFGSSSCVQQSEPRSTQPVSGFARVEGFVSKSAQATASFVPPEQCVEDQRFAKLLGAVQACVQRFSPTHEFAVALWEYKLRPTRENAVVNEKISAIAVDQYIAKLRAANEGKPGITLGAFEVAKSRKPEDQRADHCSLVFSAAIDRRVPKFQGEEFRIWAETLVCARSDSSDNVVQVVELRSSERFRVKTDRFRERFEYRLPLISAFEARESLKMY